MDRERSKGIGISFTPQQLAKLDAFAAASGLSRSAAFHISFERFCRQQKVLDLVSAWVSGVISADKLLSELKKLVRTSTTSGAAAGG